MHFKAFFHIIQNLNEKKKYMHAYQKLLFIITHVKKINQNRQIFTCNFKTYKFLIKKK